MWFRRPDGDPSNLRRSISWPSVVNRQSGQFRGAAGLNVPACDGVAVLTATPAGTSSPQVDVRAGGIHVRTVQLAAGEAIPIRALWPPRGLAFVELAVIPCGGRSGGQEDIHVSVAGR